jgi:hypothetical protein
MSTTRSLLLAIPLFAGLFTAPLAAQDDERPRFRIGLGLGAGDYSFDTEGSSLRDSTDAGMFRLEFEGTGRRGIGGGIRLESFASDDDLFAGTGFAESEAVSSSIFAHFTYRVQTHRFSMPIRAGLLLNGLSLEERITGNEVTYGSLGPYFEIEPELVLAGRRKTQWSIYGELGFGGGFTVIEIDNDSRDFESSTGFFGLELGTRLKLNKVELSLAYVGRWQSMDRSDPEGGARVLGYDADFQGLMIGVAVVF